MTKTLSTDEREVAADLKRRSLDAERVIHTYAKRVNEAVDDGDSKAMGEAMYHLFVQGAAQLLAHVMDMTHADPSAISESVMREAVRIMMTWHRDEIAAMLGDVIKDFQENGLDVDLPEEFATPGKRMSTDLRAHGGYL